MKRLFIFLLPLLLVLPVACQAQQQPQPVATEVAQAAATTAMETETVAPAEASGPVVTDTAVVATTTDTRAESAATATATEAATLPLQTGVAIVDELIAATQGEDLEALRPLLHFITVPCTTADGLGGPPKCEEEQTEGTPVEVFPIWGPEGHYVQPHNVDIFLESLQLGPLYAVYQVADAGTPQAEYEPAGEYGVVFSGAESDTPVTLLVDERGIVRAVFAYGETPAGVVERASGELLLGPLQ